MDMYQKRKVRAENKKNNNQENSSKVGINWFPGHMAKTMKQIEQDLKLVDIVIEILDARIPLSSQNPNVQKLIANKKKIIVLNKSDLANEKENIRWVNYFANNHIPAILFNSTTQDDSSKVINKINEVMEEERKRQELKGRNYKIARVMVIGIPNVGKSSFINRIANKMAMQVGNKPGVTKQKQWIRLANNIELLDTPGVLWPKLGNEDVSIKLAYTGTIKSEVIDETEIAYNLTKFLLENYRDNIIKRYKISKENVDKILANDELEENEKIVEIMNDIGKMRGAVQRGNTIDLDKTSRIILSDFRSGNLGRITLERINLERMEK